MIRDKKTHAPRDALEAPHSNSNSHDPDKEHHALDARPVHRIGILCDKRVNEQRRPNKEDIQGQKDANEKCSEHGLAKLSRIPCRRSRRNVKSIVRFVLAPTCRKFSYILRTA